MTPQQGKKPVKRAVLHPRNPHQGRYNLTELCLACPELSRFIRQNPNGDNTIDFSNENAVLCLNQALLAHYYRVTHWQIPPGYLCPPIPGRADYIHYAADLLARSHRGTPPTGKQIQVLDIGTGANCIYPIVGSQSYGWSFLGSDIDPVSVSAAKLIVQANRCLTKQVKVIQQTDAQAIFNGVVKAHHRFDLTLCNPPFHASLADAQAGSERKWKNLNKDKPHRKPGGQVKLNFGGQKAELWCSGGEIAFLRQMAKESVAFADQVCWFTSLVSKGDNVSPLKKLILQLGAKQCEVVQMSQGQKVSRLMAWSFMTTAEQTRWASERWNGA